MISRLTGILAIKKAPHILVDCHGVGYEADVSMTTYYDLPETGEPVSIWTHLIIRDDAHSLVGFISEQERQLFRQLIKVNGVGPKLALTILSGISHRDFAICVSQNDVASLTRLPGVGKKTAERLIIEMRDRIEEWGSGESTILSSSPGVSSRSVKNEAIEALQALGYKPLEAERMVRQALADSSSDTGSADLIRKSLQRSSR
ncbi:MAG: Holliday junction DNA helicase RuvA [Gammaproteobacteria bacterium]|jgi:Holliday junction DNA helicase RuvA